MHSVALIKQSLQRQKQGPRRRWRLSSVPFLRAALEATSLLSLNVAGVDMISLDIRVPWHANDAVINEVNYSPLLGGAEIRGSTLRATWKK
jgi:hypothetical protein